MRVREHVKIRPYVFPTPAGVDDKDCQINRRVTSPTVNDGEAP